MFKNEKGLTLIELLITISVLAIVSAIALPVINNVVSSSNSNASTQTQSDVTDFITKYNAAGEVLVSTDGRTLQGFVDTDGDNTIDANELVDTLTIDSKFSFSAAGTSDAVGGTYTSKGITGATIGLASTGGSTAAPVSFTTTLYAVQYDLGGGDFGGTGSCNWPSGNSMKFYCGLSGNASNLIAALSYGDKIELTFDTPTGLVSTVYTVDTAVVNNGTPTITVQETTITGGGEFKQLRL